MRLGHENRAKRSGPALKCCFSNELHSDGFVVYAREVFNKRAKTQTAHDAFTKRCRYLRRHTYEVAETKVAQVTNFARQHQHPLQCTMEKE